MYYTINEEAARRAKEMNSFSDYVEGSATAEYRRMVDKASELAERQKGRVDPMYHEKIDGLLDAYARRLAENMNNGYRISAMCPSVLIAGPAKFPVKKKARQNAASDRNLQEFREIQGLLDKIRSVGTGGISSDDPLALDKLRVKLAGLEQLQATMKAVNAYYRQNKTLDGCPNLTPEQIEKLKAAMAGDWRATPRPFESFQLSGNNAKIKRIKERIAELEKRQADPAPEGWKFDGGEVVINNQLNRLQIIFDGKPDDDLRALLKSHGFRWAPSQGAWQRQYTDNAVRAAKAVLGEY